MTKITGRKSLLLFGVMFLIQVHCAIMRIKSIDKGVCKIEKVCVRQLSPRFHQTIKDIEIK